jgi:lysyl-tRNA synthetase class 2
VREFIDAFIVPAPANLAYAVFLGVLAAAIARRKRVAYWVLVGYLLLGVITGAVLLGLLSGGLREELVDDTGRRVFQSGYQFAGAWVSPAISLLLLAGLIASRGEFYARVRRGSLRLSVVVFLGLVAAFAVAGYLIVTARPGTLRGPADRLTYAVERVLGGAIQFDLTRSGSAPGWVNLLLGLFGAVALFAALHLLLRSQRALAVLPAEDERRIRELLQRYGHDDSLGYFATRRDKAAIFAPSAKAAVTYRAIHGVSLASADPIGDRGAWPAAIQQWLEDARRHAWTPAVVGASEAGAKAYAKAGLKVIEVGDEAILTTADFSLDGRDMRAVRQAVHRIQRAGYTILVRRHSQLAPPELADALRYANLWRDTEVERGYSMALGRLGDPNDADCVLVEAVDPSGTPAALLSLSPWGRDGLSLDLMRRDSHGDNGLMEFMVAGLMAEAPKLGVVRVSLNFAAFRAVFEEGARIGAGPILRAMRNTLLVMSRWFQMESLYRSNAKYQPHWVPRYLCFGERRDFAKVGLALMLAEGLIRFPWSAKDAALDHRGTAPIFVDGQGLTAEADGSRAAVTEPEQVRVRLAKLAALTGGGGDAYPRHVARTDTCADVVDRFAGLAADSRSGQSVGLAGRILLVRDHGHVCFATLRDWTGDLQILLDTPNQLDRWRRTVDVGDLVAVTGEVITTRRGQLTVSAAQWTLTAKSLHPLPDKHRGLVDPEARVRQRHVDLMVNPRPRQLLRIRSAVLHSLRTSLLERAFIEVETPTLQPTHAGANARPFVTHSSAYDLRMYLRTAPRLYLKRLAVGGVERLFELGRVFYNEAGSLTDNPEFTMLEAYQAYADYRTMRELAQHLIQSAAIAACGKPVALRARGADVEEVDLSGEWPTVTFYDAISNAVGEPVGPSTSAATLAAVCDRARVAHHPDWSPAVLARQLYRRMVEARTSTPTFYFDFPVEVAPLTRSHPDDPRLAERWDLVAFGAGLATAFSELTDPVEQRHRLAAPASLGGGDAEPIELDEDFLQALAYGLPPTGGLGLGVDRLVMLLTGESIRQALPFPTARAAG